MRVEDLFEATVVGMNHNSPLKDGDTVRVYHGTSDINTLIVALTKGITGGKVADRKYSYESNNNPRGLFVTPDLRVAKEFGDYVMEFHTRVSDMEAPVWPGGTFTVQGGMSGIFDSDDDREAERLRQRMRWSEDELEFVRDSDRPELAAIFLASGERQALFTGDLNANSIRAIWASADPTRIGQTYTRLSPREFMKMANANEIPSWGSKTGLDHDSDVATDSRRKLVNPRDEVSGDDIIDALDKKFKMDRSQIIKILKDHPEQVRKYVWSDRQFNQVMNDIRNMR